MYWTMLFFRVPILQSEDAPTQERETLWVQQQGKRWDGDLGCFFCAYGSVRYLGPFIISSSWDSWRKATALPSECNCMTIPGFIFKTQFQKEDMCLWNVQEKLKMWSKGDPGNGMLLLGRFYSMWGENVLGHQLVQGQGMVEQLEQWSWPFSLQTPWFVCPMYVKLVTGVSNGSHCSHRPPLLL